ncbi:MAG: hypothetical protein FWG88_00965 [Oscillospiraceae bacterium]|nr:hypothetical protein [Oscillospiraceae bacterium]
MVFSEKLFKNRYFHTRSKPLDSLLNKMLLFIIIYLGIFLLFYFYIQNSIVRLKLLGGFYSVLVFLSYCFWSRYTKKLSKLQVENNGYMKSKYSQKKYKTTSKIMHYSPYAGIVFMSIIILIICSDYDEAKLTKYLVVSIIFAYYLQLILTAFYFDLICIFTNEFFITGKYIVHYKDVNLIDVKKTKNALQDQVVFIRLYKADKLVGVDKLTLQDYIEHDRLIKEHHKQNNYFI